MAFLSQALPILVGQQTLATDEEFLIVHADPPHVCELRFADRQCCFTQSCY
jgi:hypothetical protein